jgi:hypothetical protein
MKFPEMSVPVSSLNSLFAAVRASSVSSNSPLGMDQEPRSFLAQKGPPGWTRKNSGLFKMRYNKMPALFVVGLICRVYKVKKIIK